jgi:hypothetical protein
MDELNKIVNNLSVQYGSYNTCKSKKTSASLRKELQKLKAYATSQRKDILNSVKPLTPVEVKDEVKDEVKNEVKDEVKDEPVKKVKKVKKVIKPVEPFDTKHLKVIFPVS